MTGSHWLSNIIQLIFLKIFGYCDIWFENFFFKF